VVIDGLGVLRRDLEPVHRSDACARLDALLLSPPPRVTLLIGNDATAGLGQAVVSRAARRFVLHLHEPGEAGGLGVRPVEVPPAVPGRFLDVVRGCEGQFATWPTTAGPVGAAQPVERVEPVERVTTLPVDVTAGALPGSWSDERSWFVPIGLAHDDLRPAMFEVPHGEHLLVVGPARSGRSEVLAGLRRSWSQARPDAAQVVITPRRLSSEALGLAVRDAVVQVEEELGAGRPVLFVIDDADLVADAGGVLAATATAHQPLLTMAVACRPDSVRSSYGHWAASLRRHRRGVLMASCDELDGDLLGATLPRHLPVASRPGLCWLVGDGSARLVQAARRGEPA
jgi:S-DNA-T family DNA segregation ATPase FtsK/SpoIIIE